MSVCMYLCKNNINKAYHDLLRYYFNEKKNSQLELHL